MIGIGTEKMHHNKLSLFTLIAISAATIVGVAYFLPWHFGLYGIDRYPYATAYKVIFILLLIFFISYQFFAKHRNSGLLKCLLWGAIYGYFASLVAYILSFSFFYVSGISIVGLAKLGEMVYSSPLRNTIQLLAFPVMLLGWLYGAILVLIVRVLGKRVGVVSMG